MKRYAIGVDMGGTNTRIALVDGGAGRSEMRIVAKDSCPTRAVKTPKRFIELLSGRIDAFFTDGVSRREVAGIGMGVPGSVNVATGQVHFLPNIPGWRNVPLGRWAAEAAGFPVKVDNDANAMACGEFMFGAARGARQAVFVTLGTGVGGGLLVNGRLFAGRTFSAAEIGHIRYRAGGKPCACGSRGCIETELGSTFLEQKASNDLKHGAKTLVKKIAAASPRTKLRLEMITQAARRGDAYALRFWRETGEILGDFLAGICNLLNPEIIVIGGGVAEAGPFLFGPAREALKRNAFPEAARSVRIVKARFGPDAGLIGAATLAFYKGREGGDGGKGGEGGEGGKGSKGEVYDNFS